jgi:A/G-specific adenine glycosylase
VSAPGTAIPTLDSPHIARLHRALLRWYRTHGRTLPWRGNHDPYQILVSEFMLQQTQVARVIEAFRAWCVRFPTVHALARARRREVLLAWRGLGYNRRALHLHEAARAIVDLHAGELPRDIPALQSLPGIGPYTARAVACFGMGMRTAVVDVNVERILVRIAGLERKLPVRELQRVADEVLPRRAWYDWNQALMDLGAMVCTAAAPRCDSCPLRRLCASAGMHALPAARPRHARVLREPPRRFYRGRVIALLRDAPGHRMSLAELGLALKVDYHTDDLPWLHDIVVSLMRDGLLRPEALLTEAKDATMRSDPHHVHLELVE